MALSHSGFDMRAWWLVLMCFAASVEAAPTDLFTQISFEIADNSPPPPDALTVFRSVLDINGLAPAPADVRVRIPDLDGEVLVEVHRRTFEAREGYDLLSPSLCSQTAECAVVPIPGLPVEQFSYSWLGRSADDLYDLRLTVHRGFAVGVFVGPGKRFGIAWDTTKKIRMEYFFPQAIQAVPAWSSSAWLALGSGILLLAWRESRRRRKAIG